MGLDGSLLTTNKSRHTKKNLLPKNEKTVTIQPKCKHLEKNNTSAMKIEIKYVIHLSSYIDTKKTSTAKQLPA